MTASTRTARRCGSSQVSATVSAPNAASPVAVSQSAAPSTSRANDVTDVTSRVRAPCAAVRVPRIATRATSGIVASSRVTSHVPRSREAATPAPPVAAASSRAVVTVVSRGPAPRSWRSGERRRGREQDAGLQRAGHGARGPQAGTLRSRAGTACERVRRPLARLRPARPRPRRGASRGPAPTCQSRRFGRSASPTSTSTTPRAGSSAGASTTASMLTSEVVLSAAIMANRRSGRRPRP